MSEQPAVRARARYTSPRRQRQAAETRADVLHAAGALFAERGWAATGMRDVARTAGVAVETVYANFASKADLLTAALDVAIVGDALPVPLSGRAEFTAISRAGGLAERAAAAAQLTTQIHIRTAGIELALREAAAADPDLANRLRAGLERQRIQVQEGLPLVAGRPVTPQERDTAWAIGGVEVYHLLTGLSGWTPEEYQAWLADIGVRLLGP